MASLPEKQFQDLIDRVSGGLQEQGWLVLARRPIDYGITLALDGGGLINLYNGKKGPKAVLSGKLSSTEKVRLEEQLEPFFGAKKDDRSSSSDAPSNLFRFDEPWIGCDESGKGDYFGPLVVAAVLVRPEQIDQLIDAGVRDGKRVTDRAALRISSWIEQHCACSLRCLMPTEYNTRYAGNLNHLLSELHAETIGELAEAHGARRAVSDQFGNPMMLRRLLSKHELQLTSIPKAEQDVAVAAASIVARAHFLDGLKNLSADATLELPPGAGPQVVSAGRQLVKLFGSECLRNYAKLHFRTTAKVAP